MLKLAVANGTVYVSLSFGWVDERCRGLVSKSVFLVAIDATAGAGVRWCSTLSPILALAAVGDRVYGGGGWPGYDQRFLRVVSAGAGVLGGWDPRPNGAVASLVGAGDGVVAGGWFSGFDRQSRTTSATIDLDTGSLLPFDPKPQDRYGTGSIAAFATARRQRVRRRRLRENWRSTAPLARET